MKKSKKKRIIFGSIAVAVAIVVIIVMNTSEVKLYFAWMQPGEEADHRSYTSDFDENYNSFQSLADYILGNSELRGDRGIVSIDESDKDKLSLMIFKGVENVSIPISDQIEQDIINVKKAFSQDHVTLTMLHSDGENRVAFIVLDEESAKDYLMSDRRTKYHEDFGMRLFPVASPVAL